jgi:hypothetical protein
MMRLHVVLLVAMSESLVACQYDTVLYKYEACDSDAACPGGHYCGSVDFEMSAEYCNSACAGYFDPSCSANAVSIPGVSYNCLPQMSSSDGYVEIIGQIAGFPTCYASNTGPSCGDMQCHEGQYCGATVAANGKLHTRCFGSELPGLQNCFLCKAADCGCDGTSGCCYMVFAEHTYGKVAAYRAPY